MNTSHIKKITVLSLYSAIALTIFLIEAALPALAPIPGIKLGLANIITLLVLCRYSAGDAAMVLTVRIVLAVLLSGQAVYMIYSICGGVLCLIIMTVSNRLMSGRYIYLTSILGAIAHNIGQILAAFFILRLSGIFVYIPYLIISGIATGLFTGLVCHFTLKKLPVFRQLS